MAEQHRFDAVETYSAGHSEEAEEEEAEEAVEEVVVVERVRLRAGQG